MKQASQTWLFPRVAQLLSRLPVSLFRLGHPGIGTACRDRGAQGMVGNAQIRINPDPELKSWLWFLLAS